MNEINFFNKSSEDVDQYIPELKELINYAVDTEKLDNLEFSIIFVSNEYIKKINIKYRDIDKETDVLTFVLEDTESEVEYKGKRILGDIYISVDKAFEQAKEYNHSILRELGFLLIHGFLHLTGYDHDTEKKEKDMKKKQEMILNGCRITRQSKTS